MASIKGNIILNGLNTLTSLIYPLITFPYAARVLMPEGIGAVNFLNSIISYITLLTSIGIPLYAVKEIAKYQDNRANRDKITIEIILLSSLLCFVGYIAVWLLAKSVPQIHEQSALFYILSLSIIFTSIGVNWFYQGIEDFKYITVRAIVIRTIAAIALFTFVKSQSDLLIYGVIVVGSTVGNNFINFVHLRKHINISSVQFKDLNIFRHLKPALHVFVLNLIISLYVQLNSIMLGFISGDDAVGFFTAGTKITHIGLTVITSIGTVLLPRCSALIKEGDLYGFSQIIQKSLNLTLGLSVPITIGLMVLAVPITMVFCGSDYIASIPVLYWNAPVVVLISLTNLLGIQILYPMDKVNIVILSVSAGAIINLLLNFILISLLGATGAAISTLFAELAVLCIQIIFGKKFFPFKLKMLWNWKYIAASIIMVIAILPLIHYVNADILKIGIGLTIGVITYAASLIIMKDSLILSLSSAIKTKLKDGLSKI